MSDGAGRTSADVPIAQGGRRVWWLVVAASAYVAAGLMANVMSVRIVRLLGFSIDAGTLVYPITFTLRDVVHKLGGRNVARVTVLSAAGLNVVMALAFWVASLLPADPAVTGAPQDLFGPVLVGTWRIVVASIVAQVVSELIDTEVYQRVVERLGRRAQWARVVVSNAVSIPVDSVVFVVIAFAGTMSFGAGRAIVWANIVVKGLTSLVSFPLIYLAPDEAVVSRDDLPHEAGAAAASPGERGQVEVARASLLENN